MPVRRSQRFADDFEKGLDGIAMVAENEFIISNYQGILYYLKADRTKEVLLDTRADHVMANDISYDSETRTLYVPSFSGNCINAYKVKDAANNFSGKNMLIVYLSRTGNTQAVARIIQKEVGGKLVALELVNPYPQNYQA